MVKMKKYILLDFDGVMVKNQPWKKIDLLDDGFYKFDDVAIENLKRIIKETLCDIVIISSHKVRFTDSEWNEIFKRRGITTSIKTIDNKTNKKEEIINWVNKNKSSLYIIIDDDKTLNDLTSNIKDRFVLIDSGVGLTKEKTDIIIEKLNIGENRNR